MAIQETAATKLADLVLELPYEVLQKIPQDITGELVLLAREVLRDAGVALGPPPVTTRPEGR